MVAPGADSRFCSKPLLLVHHVPQLFPTRKSPHIVQERRQVPLGHARRGGGAVRRDDRVLHFPQRVSGRQRLGLEHIETCAGNLPGSERRRQIREIDDHAPAHID